MRKLIQWLMAMLSVYMELLIDPRVNDRARVTLLAVIVSACLIFGWKALIFIVILMIVFALHDETLQSKIHNKLRK